MAEKRNAAVDSLKGAAILTVVLIHVFRDGGAGVLIGEIGRWAVPAFFMVQGYYLRGSVLKRWPVYSLKRLGRVYLPFLAWSAGYGIYFWLVDRRAFTLSDVLLGETAVHLYFVIYYMLFALLLPFLYLLPQRLRRCCYWVMIFSNFGICSALELQRSYGIHLFSYSGINPVKWWGFVALGMLAGEQREVLAGLIKRQRRAVILISAGLAAAGTALPFLTGTVGYMYNRSSLFPLAFGCTAGLLALFDREGVPGRDFLAFLGRRSFSIYLSHFLVVHYCKYVLGFDLLWAVAVLALAVSLLTTAVAGKVCERLRPLPAGEG